MKAEVIAQYTGISLTAENEIEENELQLLKREINLGERKIYSQMSNGDWNYQVVFNIREVNLNRAV